MNYNLYAIYDKVAGTISAPFLAVNEETAKRNLKERQKAMEAQGLDYVNDIELVYIAKYNITPKLFEDTDGGLILENVIQKTELNTIDAELINME